MSTIISTPSSYCCAALAEREVDELLRMRQAVVNRGIPVNPVDAKDLHLLMSGFFTSLFEMITLLT